MQHGVVSARGIPFALRVHGGLLTEVLSKLSLARCKIHRPGDIKNWKFRQTGRGKTFRPEGGARRAAMFKEPRGGAGPNGAFVGLQRAFRPPALAGHTARQVEQGLD